MAAKVIVELKAKAGRRDELRILIEQLAARDRPSGYHGSTYYESLDDPDLLIDIADWESPEARTTHLAEAMAAGAMVRCLSCWRGPSGPPSSAGGPESTASPWGRTWRARRASGAHEQHTEFGNRAADVHGRPLPSRSIGQPTAGLRIRLESRTRWSAPRSRRRRSSPP